MAFTFSENVIVLHGAIKFLDFNENWFLAHAFQRRSNGLGVCFLLNGSCLERVIAMS